MLNLTPINLGENPDFSAEAHPSGSFASLVYPQEGASQVSPTARFTWNAVSVQKLRQAPRSLEDRVRRNVKNFHVVGVYSNKSKGEASAVPPVKTLKLRTKAAHSGLNGSILASIVGPHSSEILLSLKQVYLVSERELFAVNFSVNRLATQVPRSDSNVLACAPAGVGPLKSLLGVKLMLGSWSFSFFRQFLWVFATTLVYSSAFAQSGPPSITGRVSILDFGGQGDGVADNTPAFNAAVAAAMPKSFSIFIPCGIFRFASKPNRIETGIKIVGCGSTGSTPGYGSALLVDYDEPTPEEGFLSWTGAFSGPDGCCAGTGGGLEQISIYKAPARKGGTAIKIIGIDDGHRPGFMTLSDIQVSGRGAGTWDHNLLIDGTCCTTPGGQGVRDIYISNFWAAGAVTANQSVLLRSAVQVFWHGGEVMPAQGGTNTGVTITGGISATQQSVNIFISDVYIAGNFSVSNASVVSFRGFVGGSATIDKSAANTTLGGVVGGSITNSSTTTMIETNQIFTLPPGKQIVASGLATGSANSTDLAGQIKLVAGKGSYKFTRSYATQPICVAQDVTAPKPVALSVTNLGFSLAGSGTDSVSFICIARK